MVNNLLGTSSITPPSALGQVGRCVLNTCRPTCAHIMHQHSVSTVMLVNNFFNSTLLLKSKGKGEAPPLRDAPKKPILSLSFAFYL